MFVYVPGQIIADVFPVGLPAIYGFTHEIATILQWYIVRATTA